jgi:hypothetical protein
VTKPDTEVQEESLFDAIAALLPPERRERFYRRMAHLKQLQPDDEMLQIAEAMGFLALIIGETPAKITDERRQLAELMSSALTQMQEASTVTTRYHTQLEGHLSKLPGTIANGIAPGAIASKIGETLRQHLMATGIQTTVDHLSVLAKNMETATTKLGEAWAKVADEKRGLLPEMDKAASSMRGTLDYAANQVRAQADRLYWQARPRLPWAFVAVLVLIIGGLIYRMPSQADLHSFHMDAAAVLPLPASSIQLVEMVNKQRQQVDQLKRELQDTKRQLGKPQSEADEHSRSR